MDMWKVAGSSFVAGMIFVIVLIFGFGEPLGAWVMARGAQLRAVAQVPVEHTLEPDQVAVVTRVEPSPAPAKRHR